MKMPVRYFNVVLIDERGSVGIMQVLSNDVSDVVTDLKNKVERDAVTYIEAFIFDTFSEVLRRYDIEGTDMQERLK